MPSIHISLNSETKPYSKTTSILVYKVWYCLLTKSYFSPIFPTFVFRHSYMLMLNYLTISKWAKWLLAYKLIHIIFPNFQRIVENPLYSWTENLNRRNFALTEQQWSTTRRSVYSLGTMLDKKSLWRDTGPWVIRSISGRKSKQKITTPKRVMTVFIGE